MRRVWIYATSVCFLAVAARAQQTAPDQQPKTPEPQQKTANTEEKDHPDKTYWKHTVSPVSGARAAMGAAVNQANNTPSEWGQGGAGFGKRLGSAIGKHLVKKGIQYPVAKLFHEELHYQRSEETGFGPRLKYALVNTVMTHKTTTGQSTISKSELAGAFGSGLISRLWQPASVRTLSAGFTSGGITIAIDAAGNVVKEFWPEIRHPHSHGAAHSKTTPTDTGSTSASFDGIM